MSKIPKTKMVTAIDGGGLGSVVPGLAPADQRREEWVEMHEKLKEVARQVGVGKAGQRVAGRGRVAWKRTSKETFLLANVEQERVFHRRSDLCEISLSVWRVDRRQALRMCEDRRVEVNASDASDVSLAKVDDPWPS